MTNYPDPSGEGLALTVEEAHAKWTDDVIAASGATGKQADELRISLNSQRPGYTTKAAADGLGKALDYSKVTSETALATLNNSVRSDGNIDDKGFNDAVFKGYDVIDNQPGDDLNAKAAAKHKFLSDISSARFDALLDAAKTPADVDAIEAELKSAKWAERFLGPYMKAK